MGGVFSKKNNSTPAKKEEPAPPAKEVNKFNNRKSIQISIWSESSKLNSLVTLNNMNLCELYWQSAKSVILWIKEPVAQTPAPAEQLVVETPAAEPVAPERTPTKAAEAAVDEMIEEAKTKVEETKGLKFKLEHQALTTNQAAEPEPVVEAPPVQEPVVEEAAPVEPEPVAEAAPAEPEPVVEEQKPAEPEPEPGKEFGYFLK